MTDYQNGSHTSIWADVEFLEDDGEMKFIEGDRTGHKAQGNGLNHLQF